MLPFVKVLRCTIDFKRYCNLCVLVYYREINEALSDRKPPPPPKKKKKSRGKKKHLKLQINMSHAMTQGGLTHCQTTEFQTGPH